MTADERIRDRLRPGNAVFTGRNGAFSNSLHEDLSELLSNYAAMCRLAGELAIQLYGNPPPVEELAKRKPAP